MLERLTSRQMGEWLAYLNIEGLPSNRADDQRAGTIAAAVANFSTWNNKEPLQASDFFPSLRDDDQGRKAREPILLADPEAHARLVMSQVFGTTMEKAYEKK